MQSESVPNPVTPDEVFRPDVKVTVEFTDPTGRTRHFVTTVHSVENTISIVAPSAEKGIRMRLGQELTLSRFVGWTAYVSQVKLLAYRHDDLPVLVVSKPASVERQPRRRFFRVDIEIPFKCSFCEGMITNASGNGLLLSSTKDCFREGAEFYLTFSLPGRNVSIEARVQVRRVFQDNGRYFAGVQITSIRPRMQDELIRYLLRRQQELPKEKSQPRARQTE